jgi:hypothetical protein
VNEIGGKGLLIGGILVGFFVIPPLASRMPVVVNSFLLLVLLSSLLLNQSRWLPVFDRFAKGVNSATGTKSS